MQKRKRFTKEFKLEALRLMKESGKSAAEIARELGIRRNQLYKWQKKLDNGKRFGHVQHPLVKLGKISLSY